MSDHPTTRTTEDLAIIWRNCTPAEFELAQARLGWLINQVEPEDQAALCRVVEQIRSER